MSRRRDPGSSIAWAVALLVVVTGCGGPSREGAGEARVDLLARAESAAQVITPDLLREEIAYLSSDELAGRGPGSEGDRLARRYLAQRLDELGLDPAAPGGGWEQSFEVVEVTASVPPTWSFQGAEGSEELERWEEFVAFSDVQEPSARIRDAEVVFVGYGIQAPEYEWDDYQGADLEGKVLLMLNNDPDWSDDLFAGERRLYYGRWTYKYEAAAEQGAAGAIIIHTTPSAGYPWQVVQTSWTGAQFELPAGDEPRIQVGGWVTEAAARRLVELAGEDLDALREAARSPDFAPVPLGVRTSLELTTELERVETANVLGVLPGGDPALAREMVVYTAHHDHLGVGEPDAEGDRIYNGALDNAAGVAQVLAVAKAFQELPEPPRRSILVALVAAEEQGLLGSEYLAENPPAPAGRLAANINHDGGNIWGRTSDVTYIGYGKSDLDRVVERYAEMQGRTVEPDQFPDKGYFYRSDQFSLAKIGVPAIYLDNGTRFIGRPEGWGKEQIDAWTEVTYHQPSDELDESWNFEGMVEDAWLSFYCGLHIAEQDELPAWNPGDEFEAARLEALESLPE